MFSPTLSSGDGKFTPDGRFRLLLLRTVVGLSRDGAQRLLGTVFIDALYNG